MKDMIHDYICRDCAKEKGAVFLLGKACIIHDGVCNYCKKEKALYHLTEWNWSQNRELEIGKENEK